jgi:hypothetical protein
MLDAFAESKVARELADHVHVPDPEEEDDPSPRGNISCDTIVQTHSLGDIARAIKFSWDEFRTLFRIVADSLRQTGRGSKRSLESIDAFFIFVLSPTSIFTAVQIATHLLFAKALVQQYINHCIQRVTDLLEAFFPTNLNDVHCPRTFRVVSTSCQHSRLVARFY